MTTHSLERTSPLGGKFVGRCMLCDATGLPSSAALERCQNPRGVTSAAALIDAIERLPDSNGESEHA